MYPGALLDELIELDVTADDGMRYVERDAVGSACEVGGIALHMGAFACPAYGRIQGVAAVSAFDVQRVIVEQPANLLQSDSKDKERRRHCVRWSVVDAHALGRGALR